MFRTLNKDSIYVNQSINQSINKAINQSIKLSERRIGGRR
jgi:hypothetical protein